MAKWIAAGFIAAFAASIGTVIYTGLNVEGSRAEFDAGFRPVTLAVGEARTVDLVFEANRIYGDAMLEVTLPDGVDAVGFDSARVVSRHVELAPGPNTVAFEVRATRAGSGYLIATVAADAPIGLYRVFVTVTGE